MKKDKKVIVSEIRKELKTTAKDIGKARVKVAKTAKKLKLTAKERRGVRVKVAKTAEELKTTAREIGKTRLKVVKVAEGLNRVAKGQESKSKLSKGVAKLKKTAKKKEKIRIKVAEKVKKLKIKVKEEEKDRFKLVEIAKQLAKTANIKEVARIHMAKKAEKLSKVARERERVRIQLEKTAAIIKELSDRNEAILSSIGDAAFACDRKGKIILFNKMAEELTGVAKKDALGTHYNKVTNFISEKAGRKTLDFISDAIKNKKRTQMEMDTILVRRDGKEIPVADVAAPIFDTSGKVTGCVVVFRDVTKERTVERAKTELVSLSSHQLRTPLTAIGWYVELLESKTSGVLTRKQLKLTKEIRDAHKRMTTLINSLLNASRLEMGTISVEPRPTNINTLVNKTIAMFKHQIHEKRLVLTKELDDDLDNFSADPRILGEVFQNLISNAVKYTPSGGKIKIEIKKQKSLEISISDTGMGIPKYQQSKIFSKLFRADNANNVDPSGTGLGLYVVYQLIEISGGKIRFESTVGKGTIFYVSYPLNGMTKRESSKSLS